MKSEKREEKLMEAFGCANVSKTFLLRSEVIAKSVFKVRSSGRFDRPKCVRLTERELALICAMAMVGVDR